MPRLSKGARLLLLGVALVVIDQLIKVLVKTSMTLGESIPVLGNWFQLLFVENKCMAFGMSFGGVRGKYLLTVFRLLLFGALVWWISRLLKRNATLAAAGSSATAGANQPAPVPMGESTYSAVATLGSYAPFMQGKVVDMFFFPLFRWPDWMPFVGGHIFFEPVFNFADSCVTCGAIYLLLFHWKFFSKE